MRRIVLAVAVVMTLCWSGTGSADTTVRMTGDSRVHGNWWSQRNYTGWTSSTAAGTRTYDALSIYQRFRLRSDFIANEDLKFRFGIRVNNTPWGNGTYTVDNPAVAIEVYLAYMQFKWPGSDITFTVGLQNMDLPISSSALFNANPVFGGSRSAAAMVTIPLSDEVKVITGFTRLIDSYASADPTTTQLNDELDGYLLTLPITMGGFSATPWGMLALAGKDSNYTLAIDEQNAPLASNLLALGGSRAARLRVAQNVYWWAGSSLALTMLDPFKFYADVMYGSGNGAEPARNRRSGLFFDVGAEYTGFNALTPQLSFWYSTGEDGTLRNGSERMPAIVGYWGPSNSFLFDASQDFVGGGHCMNVDPIGSWGFVAALNNISFVEKLSHRIAFTFAQGTNSSRAIRAGASITPSGYYPAPVTFVQMGRDLTVNEYVVGVNFDHQYNIYANLAAVVEAGWAHGRFERSVWGRRLVNQAESGDAWKCAVGLQYRF
ncbi:hypothetical protein NNJEOMEG_03781 [Fundidesulfovibrio magnetotacticus]|uniref:Outer membrane homotrimeric porin n=1 Tax=Fundidesulfovibrio magnetotacticus TaxID=2730080 RepID=A0A6V8M0C2_9BACT|nr:outer membrane homotrimeric porin [Fundidesulfovibrio magnetotacticus]GFK95908.1 hypothetical protein NNJEOMEG_03781 [Fundidesulfovibrio magnetotacticus]